MKELRGQRFGRLLAIEPTEQRKNGSVVWQCKCDCGNIAYVTSNSLSCGKTRSCGCLLKEKMAATGKRRTTDLTGQRFGKLVALELTGQRKHSSAVWRCICDCGNTAYVISKSLTGGNTQSCGCLKKN